MSVRPVLRNLELKGRIMQKVGVRNKTEFSGSDWSFSHLPGRSMFFRVTEIHISQPWSLIFDLE